MKMFLPLAAALVFAGPAAAQSSHAAHHPAAKPPVTAMSDKGCPKMDEMAGNMEQMKQMHQQMMGQMAQMMQSMQQQHQGMASGPVMKMPMQGGVNMPTQPASPGQNSPQPDPHRH